MLITAALLDALWIPAKAELAQVLMEHAWQRTLKGEKEPRPWPWADSSPVAVLEVPRLGIHQLVLEGASGRNLAFGPTALTPVTANDLVLSGHRDTHFQFMRLLERGDVIRLTTRDEMLEFKVGWLEIIDSRRQELVLDEGRLRLTLLTCYPFDAATAGGPLRFVVTALPVDA